MTIEEAIKIIDEWCDNGTHDFIHEALVMAKDALKAQSGKDINVRGKDTVYRQDAINALSCENPTETYIDYDDAVKAIRQLPSAEPIIRCRDCREFRRYIDTDITFCDRTEVEVKDDDFCSHAERRADERHDIPR